MEWKYNEKAQHILGLGNGGVNLGWLAIYGRQ